MTEKLDDCFAQVSPLMDSAIALMKSMNLSPLEHIAAGVVLSCDIAKLAYLSVPQEPDNLTQQQMDEVMALLANKHREIDDLVRFAGGRFGWVQ